MQNADPSAALMTIEDHKGGPSRSRGRPSMPLVTMTPLSIVYDFLTRVALIQVVPATRCASRTPTGASLSEQRSLLLFSVGKHRFVYTKSMFIDSRARHSTKETALAGIERKELIGKVSNDASADTVCAEP